MSVLTDAVVSRLQALGVGALYGVPGGAGNLDLVESAGRAGLRFVLTSTETGGALAALAHAEVSGRPGACLATLGPGAASLANGVACAYLDRAPVFVFTDRHPLAARGRYTHQQLDHAALFAPVTKWTGTLAVDAADSVLDAAARAVLTPPWGPVHLDCPGDTGPIGDVEPPSPLASSTPIGMIGDALGPALSSARKPMLIVGLGARDSEAATAVRDLCERHRVPAMVTYKAKGVVPDDHPWFAGVFTNGAIEHPFVEASDLIIGIGLDPVELIPRPWPYRQPVVGIGPWRVSDEQVPFAVQVVAQTHVGVLQVGRLLSTGDWALEDVATERRRQRRLIDVPASGLTAQRVVEVAAARLADTHRVTVDAGAHMVPVTMMWPVGAPNHMLVSNGLSTMGFALPAAIGAAIAEPARPVVALTGDGGLLMCLAELQTAARETLPIVTIVFSDQSLSLIEIKQQQKRYRPSGVALGPIDWSALATGFGVVPLLARDESELARALDEAARCAGPSLIEARIDRSNYAATFRAVRG